MPDPKNYSNSEKDYKRYMQDCMHQTMHMERKEKDRSVAQCLNMWRKEYGEKHPGKPKDASVIASLTARLDAMADEIQAQDPVIAMAIDNISDSMEKISGLGKEIKLEELPKSLIDGLGDLKRAINKIYFSPNTNEYSLLISEISLQKGDINKIMGIKEFNRISPVQQGYELVFNYKE
jgi:hypothetical protein